MKWLVIGSFHFFGEMCIGFFTESSVISIVVKYIPI